MFHFKTKHMKKLHSSGSHRKLPLLVCACLLALIAVWSPGTADAKEPFKPRKDRISVTFRNATLAEVLQQVKRQTGYYILYNSDFVQDVKGITFSKTNAPLREVLDEALRGTRLEYSIDDDTIVVRLRSGDDSQEIPPPAKKPDRTVSGRVVDHRGEPLVGVNIVIQGTHRGTVTDSDGRFSIQLPDGRDNLIFSYLGFISQTLPSASSAVVTLVPDEQEIEDVVVTGIFTRKKESYTGSATTITQSQLTRVSNKNVFESLKNIEPSLYIMDNTLMGSDPNTLPDMQLRGITSFPSETTGVTIKGNYQNRPNQPLFILDGFETTVEKVMDMDMNRIESITVLKDAAAKALYGSDAANGVIVIETKRLAGNQELVTYTGSIELTMPDLSSYNLCNAWEKLEAERIEGVYTSANPFTQLELNAQYNQLKSQVLGGLDTYWLSKPLRTGVGHKHTLSIELGDSRALRALLDFSYNNTAGVMKGSDRTVISGDVNLSYRKKDFLFRNILSVSNTKSVNSPWGEFSDYAKMNPYWSATDPETGQVARWAYTDVANPMYDALLGTLDKESYTSLTDNFYAEWQATEALKLTARVGVSVKRSDADEFYPAKHSKFAVGYDTSNMQLRKGSYQLDNGKSSDVSGEVYANYAKQWGKHYLYANVGGKIAENSYSAYQHYAEGFPNSQTADITFARQYAEGKKPVGISSITRELSFLGTASYSYDDRYNVDLTFRESASSLYGADNRWSSAWSAGVAWNLHNESFLRDQQWLKQFKLRASAGLTGNQSYDTNEVLATYLYYTDVTYHGQTGAYLAKMPNPALKWEQRMDYNVGADIMIHRATIAFDYYNSTTENMLTNVTIPTSTGFNVVKDNLGKVRNRGIEAQLSYTLWQAPTGYFNLFGAIAYNKNTIVSLSESLKAYNEKMLAQAQDKGNSTPVLIYQDGMPMNAIWAVPSLGIDPTTGKEIYVKKDGTLTYEYDSTDQVVAGVSDPKYRGNFGFSAEYKGFGLSATCTFLGGGQLYNETLVNKVENIDIYYNVDRRVLYGRWQAPGQNAMFKQLGSYTDADGNSRTEKTRPTTRFVQDNNELTFSSLSFYYEFNAKMISKLRLKRLKLAFYMNNIATLSSIRIERGTLYPFARSMSFSLTATF